jgi:hypothetical protein
MIDAGEAIRRGSRCGDRWLAHALLQTGSERFHLEIRSFPKLRTHQRHVAPRVSQRS